MTHASGQQDSETNVCALPDCGEPIAQDSRAVMLGDGANYHRRCFRLVCDPTPIVTPCERRGGRFWPAQARMLSA